MGDHEAVQVGAGPDDLSASHLAAFRALLETYRRLLPAIEARQAVRDLPLNQYDVLVQLSEADGRAMRMQELAAAVLLSKSGLTRLVDRMEATGLVRRESAAQDGRGVRAVVTDRGMDALEAAVPAHRSDVIELFASHMSAEEADVVARVLGRVREEAANEQS